MYEAQLFSAVKFCSQVCALQAAKPPKSAFKVLQASMHGSSNSKQVTNSERKQKLCCYPPV
jgi:hypothetical protein